MLLDALKDFNWYNEPENVRFNEAGMMVDVKSGTDFWQNSARGIHKDDGHFFYAPQDGNFDLIVKWRIPVSLPSAQCGLMLRLDSLNWVKISLLSRSLNNPQVGTVVTNNGFSDWAVSCLSSYPEFIWFQAQRRQGDIGLSFSLDGMAFQQIRLFRFAENPLIIKVGAYACNPRLENFNCILESVALSAQK